MGMETEGRNRSLRVRFTTARPPRRGTPNIRICWLGLLFLCRGQAGCVIVYSGKGQMMTVASTDDPILKRFKAALVNMTALAVVDANSREAPNRS